MYKGNIETLIHGEWEVRTRVFKEVSQYPENSLFPQLQNFPDSRIKDRHNKRKGYLQTEYVVK